MKPITIIGGGLAGLTLGILLRHENAPVTIHEAHRYPRHRVCGEFLSGAGRKILSQILRDLKGSSATTSSIHLAQKNPLHLKLPEPALCISRYELDAKLAEEFQNLGGELRTNSRFPSKNEAGVIHASGRRRADSQSGHLFGLKAHAKNVSASADLELHFAPNRYVGVCRLPNNTSNICGLFYSPQPIANLQNRWPEILADNIPSLARAEWVLETFCAVTAITLQQQFSENEFAIGDAAAMIPPLTGNGMSMAIESASLAAAPLIDYAREKISWPEALFAHRQTWTKNFRPRLRWAGFTQRLAFAVHSQHLLFIIAKTFPAFAQMIFARTR